MDAVFEADNLVVGHRNKARRDEKLVEGLTLTVQRGEVIALVGKSSAGKTTLLRIFAGFDQPLSGSLQFENRPVSDAYGTGRLQYLHQMPVIWEQLTVRQTLVMSARLLDKANDRFDPDDILVRMGLKDQENDYGITLSPGARARLALARAFCSAPRLLLMDEPFASVDYINRSSIAKQLSSFIRECQSAAIWVTHDLTEALRFSSKILVLHEGGGTFDLIDNPGSSADVDPNNMGESSLKLRDRILACFQGAAA